MLDLNDVALFVEVVRAGSFAATARRLGLHDQSAASGIRTPGRTAAAAALDAEDRCARIL
jgi:hypothetical protein